MNERIRELAEQALFESDFDDEQNIKITMDIFAELLIRECAQLARDTDLEDVEGGDSEVLRAAKRQILEHFGVE